MNFDAEFFERLMLAVAVGFGLHELDHAAFEPSTGGADHQTDGGGGLALAVAGVDHQQALCIFAVIFSLRFVTFLTGLAHRVYLSYKAEIWIKTFWKRPVDNGFVDGIGNGVHKLAFSFVPIALDTPAPSIFM